ncbi:hypothetical protein CY35_08G094300 [Sphagnum magellanicum]|nr:hypothetical protein CY35_08G094300 [Sphagnum magellanicum]
MDTYFDRTILRIKAIMPSGVLELQGADRRIIWDHSENCAPCHLPNLDPTIITTDDADQMLLFDNCNGGYHLLCFKPKLIQVPADIWYYSSCSPTTP